jgi:exodeoxyribonuclease VII small subunit
MAEKKRNAQPEPAPAEGVPFEQSLAELESVVKQLESADLPLEKSLELFEKGMQLSEACRKQLTEAETRVEVLLKKGQSVDAAPFDPEQE